MELYFALAIGNACAHRLCLETYKHAVNHSDAHLNLPGQQGGLQTQALAGLLGPVIESLPYPSWTATRSGNWLWSNSLWSQATGLSSEESRAWGWQRALNEADRAAFDAAWRRAPTDGMFELEHALHNVGGSGGTRWFRTHAQKLTGLDCAEPVWLGVCTEITRLTKLEARERAAQAHTASLLALARDVMRRTALTGYGLEDFMLHADSRLDAIARVNALSRHGPGGRIDLERLVFDALLAYGAQDSERVELDGPAIVLAGRTGDLIGLAINELAMNAVKHGALSAEQGRIVVRWRVEAGAEKMLRFEWLETDVTVPDVPPGHGGFGTELIESMLPKETGAVASLGFGKRGMCCTIELPLDAS